MEKIQANVCFDVVFLYENIRTCLFTHVLLYFLHLVLTFTPLHHNGKGSIAVQLKHVYRNISHTDLFGRDEYWKASLGLRNFGSTVEPATLVLPPTTCRQQLLQMENLCNDVMMMQQVRIHEIITDLSLHSLNVSPKCPKDSLGNIILT